VDIILIGEDVKKKDANWFAIYDSQSPKIWEKFQEFTLELIRAGRERIGSQLVIERIRWHTQVTAGWGSYKIDNDAARFYADKFERLWPKHRGIFTRRVRRKAIRLTR
jgi:hypothetical protein